jgi:N-acetylmuramoyl-L-alanine amidase
VASRNRVLVACVALVVVALVAAAAAGALSGSSNSAGSAPSAPRSIGTPSPAPTTTPTKHHRHHPTPTPMPPSPASPFAGITVGVDPGHNGRDFTDVSYIDHLIWNGREHEACNTTGTETDAGYTEARFNFNVATYLAADLRKAGATVVLTRTSNTGVGPCVNRRAQIINHSHAAVAIDIHADGGPADGRGFTVLEPVADGPNDNVIAASRAYGKDVRNAFLHTGMPVSTYDGTNGINVRDDLAGLNLTTVPQVLLECGNMRNATDAALLTSPAFQRRAALAIMSAMATFLNGRGR